MVSHRIVARSSPHTSLTPPRPPAECPPRITSRGRASQKLLRPRARLPAHPQQPPRPDEPAGHGDGGPHLGEGDGAVDGPALGFRERGGRGGGRQARVVGLQARARRVG
jgi:hypothetical protein